MEQQKRKTVHKSRVASLGRVAAKVAKQPATWVVGAVVLLLFVFHAWLHITNPYAGFTIVKQPYSTSVDDGKINLHKNFNLKTYSSPVAQALGYYKSGFLIVQNAWFGSKKAPSTTPEGIIADIHKLRFDPSKPYLISGDQFSVLYPRNLGVFYNSILNPHTALSQANWENRQRIYLQSVMYALDAFASENTLTTTIVPIGPRSAVLTEVHPGSVPSDTMYGMLYALQALQDEQKYPDAPYKLQTVGAAKQIVAERKADLARLVDIYITAVRDGQTGLVKADLKLAAARDGVTRQSSFYDNVVLWKTLALADKLGIRSTQSDELDALRTKIIDTYWDESEGHFNDDQTTRPPLANYSSDWLIALPTGFLSPDNAADRVMLEQAVAFIDTQRIAEPFPIKYGVVAPTDVPWAVKTFVPNYGGDAIWSYWGAQYITLLGQLHKATGNVAYAEKATSGINAYRQKIIDYRGFPETFNADGNFLQNAVYKSIRQTGWVVQFEEAVWVSNSKD